MPLFGPKRSPPFEPFKSKTYLKCAVARIKQETAKKQNSNKVLAKELGALLKEGKEEMARIRVEHLIRATNEIHGMEIVELFCDLLLARHMLIESEAQNAAKRREAASPPPELQEAIFSLCWAAGRAGIEELGGIQAQFKLLYPKAFNLDEYGQPLPYLGPGGTQGTAQPADYLPELRVNQKLRDYFGVAVPPREKVVAFLTNIGAVYAPDWEPSADLKDPKDENLIDVDNSYLAQPGQFEPGFGQPPNAAIPNATAPPPDDSLLAFADFPSVPGAAGGAVGGAASFDAQFPPPPAEKSGGAGVPGAMPPIVPNVVIPQAHVVNPAPPGFQANSPGGVQAPVVGQLVDDPGAPPDLDALEARFKAIAGGSGAPAPAQPPAQPSVAAGATDDLEARLAALSGTAPAAPAPEPAPAPVPAPAPAPAPLDDLEARLAALSGGGDASGGVPPAPAGDGDLEARLAALGAGDGLEVEAPVPSPAVAPGMPALGDDAASAALLQRQPGETMDAYEMRLSALAAVQPPAPAPASAAAGGPGLPPGADDLDMLAMLPSVPAAGPGPGLPAIDDDDDLAARFRRLQGGD